MRFVTAAATFVLLSLGSACVGPPSEVGEHYGNSTRYLRAAQTENPEPIPGRVDGLDARSAELVLENYKEGQEAQEHGINQKRDLGSFTFGTGR